MPTIRKRPLYEFGKRNAQKAYAFGSKSKTKMDNITALSNRFSELINSEFTPEQLEYVVAENKKNNDSSCATHDICDANMVMDQAFNEVMGREFVFFDDEQPETEALNEADTDLINAAWTKSKLNDFKI